MTQFVDGKVVTIVRFSKDDIIDHFGNVDDSQLQYIADVLAANVEYPLMNDDGFTDIDPTNFNDSFHDMMSELDNMF